MSDHVIPPFAAAWPAGPAEQPASLRRLGGRPRPVVLACVALMHAGVIWAVQGELRARPAPAVREPEVMMLQLVDLSPAPRKAPSPKKKTARPPPAPTRAPHMSPRPAPAEVVPLAAAPPARPPPAPSAPAAPPAAAAPTRPVVRGPSPDGDYARACAVAYPPMSRAMHEHGRVVLDVLVGRDGRARRVAVLRTSGSPRLDQAALEAMRRCRFTPGAVDGVAQDMAYEAPVEFVLR